MGEAIRKGCLSLLFVFDLFRFVSKKNKKIGLLFHFAKGKTAVISLIDV